MEGVMEALANWAASESRSGILRGVASTTSGILLATFIRTKILPLVILLVKLIWTKIGSLAILLAKFIWTKIGPYAILWAKPVLKLRCTMAGLAEKLDLKRIFQRTGPVRAAAATNGAENDVELHERNGGKAGGTSPGEAQGEAV